MQKRIGIRPSNLAAAQADEVITSLKAIYPFCIFSLVKISTLGDKNKATPLDKIDISDFFTREIDEALLKGEIDIALHSAKDLPDNVLPGLAIAAITKSIDPYEALVSKSGLKLDELRKGAEIGVSSLRRKEQLAKYRKDFKLVDIRGTIEERLTKFKNSSLDAIVVAAAALLRLGLENIITQRLAFEIIKPHPLQGSLALLVREKDVELLNFLSIVDVRKKECAYENYTE